MTINREAYLNAAYPPPLQKPAETTTLSAPADFKRFVLRWNSRKVKSSRKRADEWQECYGVLYPAGCVVRVSLSNGQTFPTQAEMESLLDAGGDFRIDWIDNG